MTYWLMNEQRTTAYPQGRPREEKSNQETSSTKTRADRFGCFVQCADMHKDLSHKILHYSWWSASRLSENKPVERPLTCHSASGSRLKHLSSLRSSFAEQMIVIVCSSPNRYKTLTRSRLVKTHLPFLTEIFKNPGGNSPSRSVFFKVKTNPVSWYTRVKGSSCSSDNVRLSWKMSPTFSLNVSRATSKRRLRWAYRIKSVEWYQLMIFDDLNRIYTSIYSAYTALHRYIVRTRLLTSSSLP